MSALVEATEQRGVLQDIPDAVLHFLEPDKLFVEGLAEKVLTGMQAESPGGADAAHLDVLRIGEVGLDYQTTIEGDRVTQRRVLTTIIDCCHAAGDKVVTVHSRRAADVVVDAFGDQFSGHYVLHWYSGSARTLRRAIANGAYVSVNSAMARSERGRSLIAEVPRPRLLSETDGPFVTIGSKPAVPADIELVLTMLAGMWSVDVTEARRIVYDNVSTLLRGLPSAS